MLKKFQFQKLFILNTGIVNSTINKLLSLSNLFGKEKYYSITMSEVKVHKKKTKKRANYSKELIDFINANDHLVSIKRLIPEKFMKCNRKPPDALYIFDKYAAIKFSFSFENHLIKANEVVEVNAGLGLLTNHILTTKVKKLHIFEPSEYFQSLWNIQDNRVRYHHADFWSIPKLMYRENLDNVNRIGDSLFDIEPKPWNCEPSMLVIGTLANMDFMKYLLYSIIFQSGIISHGRPDLLVAVTPQVLMGLTCTTKPNCYTVYRARTVLFQLFFDVSLVDKLPRTSFLPWVKKNDTTKSVNVFRLQNINQEYMYVIRITAKKTLPVEKQYLTHLWHFVTHNMISRKNKVIPQLERWIPFCGAKLMLLNGKMTTSVSQGLNIHTEFGELSPEQILTLFKQFINFSEYAHCPLQASLESSLLKMEQNEDSTSEVDDNEPEEMINDIVISGGNTKKTTS